MCGKQCRDENGFKCHLDSDSHKRQMMVFGEAPDRVIEGFSEEFEANFLELLRRSHPFSRVAAKTVYNDFIADKCGRSFPHAVVLIGLPVTRLRGAH